VWGGGGAFSPVGSTSPCKIIKFTNPQINYLITMPRDSTCQLPLYMLFAALYGICFW